MYLTSVRIQNFRAFADETVYFNDYTCLVGPNGGGKSTVLTALNIFFRETTDAHTDLLKLEAEDFHHKNTTEPITITVTFEGLNAAAQSALADYVHDGKLVVSAVATWDEERQCAPVRQYGERRGMEDFKAFFHAQGEGAPVKDLKALYVALRLKYETLPPPGTKQEMIAALHQFAAARPGECVALRSEAEFYGVSGSPGLLTKYVQWVFLPAVKDAGPEQVEGKRTALGQLLARTVRTQVTFSQPLDQLRHEVHRQYQAVLDERQGALATLAQSLNDRLRHWSHPDTSLALEWQNEEGAVHIAEPLAQVITGEGQFRGKMPRFGHGLQRSFLLALLEELSQFETPGGPTLILGCEEPELFQHPPQARHLASVMQQLTQQNSQVIVCTHSPYFVAGRQVEDVRAVRQGIGGCVCRQVTLGQIAESIGAARGEAVVGPSATMLKVQQALQPALNEIFFTQVLILVEGLEDVAYISTYLTLMDLWQEFRKRGCHLVPAGGKSALFQPLAIVQHLGIPTFVVFDSDRHTSLDLPTDTPRQSERKVSVRLKHEQDNRTLLNLCQVPRADPFPVDTLWRPNVVMWNSEMGAVVGADFGVEDWRQIADTVRAKYGAEQGDFNKNSLFIGYRLAEAWEQGKKSPTLERLCRAIIDFASAASPVKDAGSPA